MFPARRAGLSPLTSRVPCNSHLWGYCLARGLHRHIFRQDAIFHETDHAVLGILVKFLGMFEDFPNYLNGTKPGTLQVETSAFLGERLSLCSEIHEFRG